MRFYFHSVFIFCQFSAKWLNENSELVHMSVVQKRLYNMVHKKILASLFIRFTYLIWKFIFILNFAQQFCPVGEKVGVAILNVKIQRGIGYFAMLKSYQFIFFWKRLRFFRGIKYSNFWYIFALKIFSANKIAPLNFSRRIWLHECTIE